MSDYRASFLCDVKNKLFTILSTEQLDPVINAIIQILGQYEITERSTDLMVQDTENEQILKKYCACLIIDGKSLQTVAQYKRAATLLAEHLQKNYTDMVTSDIRYYLACEKQRGISNVTLNNLRSYIAAFFQWMLNEEIISKNPALGINVIKCPLEIKLPFTEVEIDALRSDCRSFKERAIIEFLFSTGVRVSELSYMEVCDVDFVSSVVRVKHGKGNKQRITYMSSVASTYLQKYLLNRKENGPMLFYNKNHKQLNSGGIRDILNRIAKRANVNNVHPHRFRRTFASTLSTKGMELHKIQKLMGHANINTTMKYIYVDDGQVKAAYNQYIA